MHKFKKRKQKSNLTNAFTLLEVMIAVIIISIVIMALLEMKGNSSFKFSKITNNLVVNQYTSFFISNPDYGFVKESVKLDDLLKEFKVDDELRRELKEIKVDIVYQELQYFGDMTEAVDEDSEEYEEEVQKKDSNLAIEIGKTILKIKDNTKKDESYSTALLRLRLQ